MKKISSARGNPPGGNRLAASTGSHCPANGFWFPEREPGQAVFVFEGSLMPMSASGPALWVLDETVSRPSAAPPAGPQY